MTYALAPICIVALGLLPSATPTEHARAFTACEAIDRAVERQGCVVEGPLCEVRTGLLMLGIVVHESGGHADAYNRDGGDAGLMQVRPGKPWAGHTLAEILGSADVGAEVGHNAMMIAYRACGGRAQWWLGAYASGHCGWAQSVAHDLCSPVWGCLW